MKMKCQLQQNSEMISTPLLMRTEQVVLSETTQPSLLPTLDMMMNNSSVLVGHSRAVDVFSCQSVPQTVNTWREDSSRTTTVSYTWLVVLVLVAIVLLPLVILVACLKFCLKALRGMMLVARRFIR